MSRVHVLILSRGIRIRMLIAVLIGVLFYWYIIGLYTPPNYKLFFTQSRQQAMTKMTVLLLSCHDYDKVHIYRNFASLSFGVKCDGNMPRGWKEMITSFMIENKFDGLYVDRTAKTVIWSYTSFRKPYNYQFIPDSGSTNLAISAMSIRSLGSNWVYYSLRGP